MRPLGAIAFIALVCFAAWLAAANREAVVFSFDALRPGGADSAIRVPLFAVLFAGALAGLVVGALYMAWPQSRLRRELKAEQARADRLQKLLADEALAGRTPASAELKRPLSRTSG